MDSEALTAFLDHLADAASDSIMPYFRANMDVENKAGSGFDPVTAADRGAEAAIRKLINERFPEHGIIGEEFGRERADADFVWVIDPIDGTRSFISGLPVWGTLIGLLKDGEPLIGMMAQPFTGERFVGDGTRAWYRGPGGQTALSVRSCKAVDQATLFTTSPAMIKGGDRVAYDRVEKAVRFARYGIDCYAYCMVAAGHADIVIETELQAYDIVALIPIIEGAGGKVTDWQGASAAAGGRIVATGDGRLHDAVLDVLGAET
ncbi:MAG: histidinol-phosphatase [Bradyrhizobium sp.]|nr:MAG: histidinol-phosphatase [Bradyrhizobium sp.]